MKAGFAEKMPEKVEIITRTPAEVRPSEVLVKVFDLFQHFFGKTGFYLENFGL